MIEKYAGHFRVSDELRPNGECWFWVIGHGFCFPARDRLDAHRILGQKTGEDPHRPSNNPARRKGARDTQAG